MLNFVVFNGGPEHAFRLGHAYLIGPDDVPTPASLRAGNGMIQCDKGADGSAGLALQFPLEGLPPAPDGGLVPNIGLVTVQTCLLPQRESPYLLSLELARHRIMTFLNRLEDWGLFDLPTDDPILKQFERARQTFTAALVAPRHPTEQDPHGYSADADRLARESLALAIDAGERLALLNAQRQLERRLSGRLYADAAERYAVASGDAAPANAPIILQNSVGVTLPGRALVGCEVSPRSFTEAHQRAVFAACDFISLPMRWVDMEPGEGEYSFTGTDRWIEWAVRKAKLPVHAGPIVDFRPASVPDWLYIWENDYETLRELVYEHVRTIVTRYRRTVSRWTVASGLHVNSSFRLSYEQMLDLTRLCVLLVRKLQPSAKVQVEIDQPWGEYYATNRQSLPPLVYADTIAQAGIVVDAYALRLHAGTPEPGCSTRDLMALSSILDRYAALERPIVVSSLAAPSRAEPATEEIEPGRWRAEWSESTQAEWLSKAMAIALAKPFVHSVCWSELTDASARPEAPDCGLMTATGQPKAALARLIDLRASLNEGRTPPDLAVGMLS